MNNNKKLGNSFGDLIFNIALPFVCLTKLSKEEYLGPIWGLIVAVSIPFIYGIVDLIRKKKINYISILGVISVLLSGVFGVLELPVGWIIAKETAIPALIGSGILIYSLTGRSFVQKILYTPALFQVELINATLESNGNLEVFNKKMKVVTYLLVFSFFLSALLNYILASILLQSQPGTVEFNDELGQMTALSFPVIAIPSMMVLGFTLFYFYRSIKKLTGLETNSIFALK